MKSIKIVTRNGKKLQVTLDTSVDDQIFSEFKHSGTRNQRWMELYVHAGKTEKHFYTLECSRWENEENVICLISKEKAIELLSEKTCSNEEIENMKKYGLEIEEA